MKKNLKKVISAVLALALSMSTFATMSFAASRYEDVPETASYAEAVEVLSALGIVSGKGEGKFDPNGLVKRSEATKMVAGMTNALKNAESRAGETKFSDVSADHWASGYINYGSSQGWISGRGGNIFDPDGNVTYGELFKFVMINAGWPKSYLESFAAFPKAYSAKAEELEIVEIGEYDNNEPATRGDVAEIIYSAMKAPMGREDSQNSEWSDKKDGWVAKYIAQNGENGTYYRSLLSEKFDAYYMEGMITATPKTDGNTKNQVTFDIIKSEKYAEEEAWTAVDDTTTGNVDESKDELAAVDAGTTNAADLINTYASAVIEIDEDTKDAKILAIFASAKNSTVEVEANLFDDELTATALLNQGGTAFADTDIKYYASENASKSDKYKIDANTKLYVNGVEVIVNNANVTNFIVNNKTGKVELVDVYGTGTKGYIDAIYVTYYTTAEVTGVADSVISLKNFKNLVGNANAIDLDTEDREGLIYNIYLNGAKASIADIKKGDILSFTYNMSTVNNQVVGIADSMFYDIYISRDVVSGKVTGKNANDKTITVAGEEYSTVVWTDFDTDAEVKTANEYEFKLDAFGRIYDAEELKSNEKYAVIIAAGNSGVNGDQVQLLLPDGTTSTYNLKKGVKVQKNNKDYEVAAIQNDLAKQDVDFTAFVVSYILKNGVVEEMTVLGADVAATNNNKDSFEFNGRTNKVNGITLTSSTIVYDATVAEEKNSADELKMGSLDSFVDGDNYQVAGWKKDGKWIIAVITKGESSYNANTAIAVVTKKLSSSTEEVDGEDLTGFALEVVEGSETKTFFVEEGTKVNGSNIAINTFAAGDAIVYKLDASGAIDEIMKVFSVTEKKEYTVGKQKLSYQDYIYSLFKGMDIANSSLITLPDVSQSTDWTKAWYPSTDADEKISLIYAPIVDVDDDTFTIAQINNGGLTNWEAEVSKNDAIQNEGAIFAVGFDEDTRVTVYDYSQSKNPVKAGTISNIAGYVTRTDADPQVNNDYEKIEWENGTNGGMNANAAKNYAFAKVVDGIATDVYVIMVEAK